MESQDDHRSGVLGGGVPIWHMGEDGPSQTVFPLPSGTGTDREIDQWLEQTRAVARQHQRSVLPSASVVSGGYMHTIYQVYDFQPPPTIMPTHDSVPPNGGKSAAAPVRPFASGWPGGAVGDGGRIRRGGGIQEDPSSIQDLRAMLATGGSSEGPACRDGAACRDGGSRDAASTSVRQTRQRQHDIQQRDKSQRSSTPPAARAPMTARTGRGTSPTTPAPAAVSAGGVSSKRKGRRPQQKVSNLFT